MLLDTYDFSTKLFRALECSTDEVMLLSAFIKVEALKKMNLDVTLKGRRVALISRWQKFDLMNGASDIEVYEYCKSNGWQFGINLNLHGKVYLIDRETVFLGSANLTSRGLQLGKVSNHEFGTYCQASVLDVKKIDEFIDNEVVWLDDSLFYRIKSDLSNNEVNKNVLTTEWSIELERSLVKSVTHLWSHELLFLSPSEILEDYSSKINRFLLHDLEILNLLPEDVSLESIAESFRKTRLYLWLIQSLTQKPLSFGALTAVLHESLLDSPKPYRSDVKKLVQNIFSWCGLLDDFQVTKPNYSSVLSVST
jgi:hypothetical protein